MSKSAILLTPHAYKTDNLDFKYTTLPHSLGIKNHLFLDIQS
jgi:hypothetical protein